MSLHKDNGQFRMVNARDRAVSVVGVFQGCMNAYIYSAQARVSISQSKCHKRVIGVAYQ